MMPGQENRRFLHGLAENELGIFDGSRVKLGCFLGENSPKICLKLEQAFEYVKVMGHRSQTYVQGD